MFVHWLVEIKTKMHGTCIQIILIRKFRISVFPVVLYEYETWSLTLGEENRLRVGEDGIEKDILAFEGGSKTRREKFA